MADPIVSVLTPVYNGQQYLEECIQSVLRQTYHDWEYIIFDNRSTDDTAAIGERHAAKDARIRVVRATEHLEVLGNQPRRAGGPPAQPLPENRPRGRLALS